MHTYIILNAIKFQHFLPIFVPDCAAQTHLGGAHDQSDDHDSDTDPLTEQLICQNQESLPSSSTEELNSMYVAFVSSFSILWISSFSI